MAKFQEHVSLHETAVQAAASGVDIPKPRRSRKPKEEPPVVRVSSQAARKHDRAFKDVEDAVYEKALELAAGNWRRLEKIDNTTIIVHNNEVH